jgi:hypothetical protein
MNYLTAKENYKEIPFEVFSLICPQTKTNQFLLKLENQNGCGL